MAVVNDVELTCVPDEKSLPPLLSSAEPIDEQRLGLRCRVVRSSGETEEYPAVRQTTGVKAQFSCCCPPEVATESARMSLVWGDEGQEEVPCKVAATPPADMAGGVTEISAAAVFRSMSVLDRYLAVWILLAMLIGVLVGYFAPGIQDAWETVKVASVSLPIAIGLWWMMYPVLCKVRFELLPKLSRSRGLLYHIGLSLIVNWVLAPLLMTGLAWATLPDLPGYRNGLILVGIARCIAMVLLWTHLAGGNSEFCAILVAVNSLLQIVFYSPLAIFYIDVVSNGGSVDVSFWTVAKSVLIFLGTPVLAAMVTRFSLRALMGAKWFDDKFLPWFGPTALIGLLFTIFVMFSLQGENIGQNIGEVARVAVPLLLYFAITFFSVMALCWYLGFAYCDMVVQSFTASSNNFELAIAVAVASYGIGSDEALAAVVGPLIEVPVLIGLVYVTLAIRQRLQWKNTGAVMEAEELIAK